MVPVKSWEKIQGLTVVCSGQRIHLTAFRGETGDMALAELGTAAAFPLERLLSPAEAALRATGQHWVFLAAH